MGSRDVGQMLLNLTTNRSHLQTVRPLKSIFEKMGRIGKALGQPGPDGKNIGVIGIHYSRYDDYRAGLRDAPIDIKPKTNHGSIYDPLQNNKSVGGIHEVDTAAYLTNPDIGYDLLQLGRKFMTNTERLSDIYAVAFERSLGHLHFIQAKSSNDALQKGARKFGVNMKKQLAQLPPHRAESSQRSAYWRALRKAHPFCPTCRSHNRNSESSGHRKDGSRYEKRQYFCGSCSKANLVPPPPRSSRQNLNT